LPNAVAPVLVSASFGVAYAILTESALSFLGLGVTLSTATWGSILASAKQFIEYAWALVVFPGVAIFLNGGRLQHHWRAVSRSTRPTLQRAGGIVENTRGAFSTISSSLSRNTKQSRRTTPLREHPFLKRSYGRRQKHRDHLDENCMIADRHMPVNGDVLLVTERSDVNIARSRFCDWRGGGTRWTGT
jgi:hypothetical protein